MNEAPWLTVITIVKDDRSGLRATADSVRGQADSGFEWLILDGASSDGTAELANDYLQRGLAASVQSQPDGGIYEAMNQGIQIALGDLVMFLNAGDVLASAEVLGLMRESWQVDQWQWAAGSVARVAENGRRSRVVPVAWRPAVGQTTMHHPATVMSRTLLRSLGGFREDLRVAADWDLFLRAHCAGAEPAVLGFTVAEFRLGGMSSAQWRRGILEQRRSRRENLGLEGVDGLLDTARTGLQIVEQGARVHAGRLLSRFNWRDRTH